MQVQEMLATSGARAVLAEYDDDGEVTGLSFRIQTPFGLNTYSLPVHAEKVYAVLLQQSVPRRFQTPEQAARIGWRILKDWLAAQFAILQTEMVSLDQIMLPFQQGADGRTVYDLYLDRQLALGPGDER